MNINATNINNQTMQPYHKYLWFCLVLVLCMVALGGVTRLTGSGLSIVEWKPLHGTLPPLNHEQWLEEFSAYKSSPEYIKKNSYMQLSDFKGIFWLEYLHRLLGRIIGIVFLSGAIYYAVKKNIPKPLIIRNIILVLLVGMQGLMGWLMVKSGLTNNPHVSHYRLCAHLLLATLITAVIYDAILRTKQNQPTIKHNKTINSPIKQKSRRKAAKILLALIILQVAYGAFVAGLKAGYIYNEFPQMSGGYQLSSASFLPPENWNITPAWRNLLEHHATVQFIHRWLAFAVLAGIIWQYLLLKTKQSLYVIMIASAQIGLGIATLLTIVAIPLASLHQLIAIILILSQIKIIYEAKYQ